MAASSGPAAARERAGDPEASGRRNGARILVVDDEEAMAAGIRSVIEREGHRVDLAASAEEAIGRLRETAYALVLTDVRMPGASGLDLLDEVRRIDPEIPVVLVTGYATVQSAVDAIRRGAFDYLPKPFQLDEVRLVVRRALERRALVGEVSFLRREVIERIESGEVVAGPAMQAVLDRARRVAKASSGVLVTGETGTGKELVAKAIHDASPRAARPFLTVNCAALAEGLIESELFGHARGAFTSAVDNRPGYFEVADGGTLLLDEIGELPAAVQSKLLRVLEDGTFQRVGETRARTADVRVIAATHRDLEAEMAAGRFREDLYYRLAVVQLRLPPLRERREEIPPLVRHFLVRFARDLGKPVTRVGEDVMARLVAYGWPGNVRELRNAVERGVLLAEGDALAAEAVPGLGGAAGRTAAAGAAAGAGTGALAEDAIVPLAEYERRYLRRVLEAAEGNKNRAARWLGITRRSLYRRLEKHRL